MVCVIGGEIEGAFAISHNSRKFVNFLLLLLLLLLLFH
jgi:hypothetical protein